MTTSTAPAMTADTIATYLIADILSIPFADFTATLDANDDASHFAELCIIDERDANDSILLPFAPDDNDPDLDAASIRLDSILTDHFDAIHNMLTYAITARAARAY